MRGTPVLYESRTLRSGIIPAYAGNTLWKPSMLSTDGGSSPRMRGTRRPFASPEQNRGIIPAYAGNTSSTQSKAQPARDHPRVCGEHYASRSNHLQPMGSSPRMRGTLCVIVATPYFAGIIPAYAGNTSCTMMIIPLPWDHPRVCGEHNMFSQPIPYEKGSSPRMRGTPVPPAISNSSAGIIPAYAGNTWRNTG